MHSSSPSAQLSQYRGLFGLCSHHEYRRAPQINFCLPSLESIPVDVLQSFFGGWGEHMSPRDSLHSGFMWKCQGCSRLQNLYLWVEIFSSPKCSTFPPTWCKIYAYFILRNFHNENCVKGQVYRGVTRPFVKESIFPWRTENFSR